MLKTVDDVLEVANQIRAKQRCKTFSYKHDRGEFVKLVAKKKYMIRFTDAVGESDKIFTTAISKEEAAEWFNEQFPTCAIMEVEEK